MDKKRTNAKPTVPEKERIMELRYGSLDVKAPVLRSWNEVSRMTGVNYVTCMQVAKKYAVMGDFGEGCPN